MTEHSPRDVPGTRPPGGDGSADPPRRTNTVAIVLGVVVVALVGLVIWLLIRGDSNTAGDTSTTPPVATTASGPPTASLTPSAPEPTPTGTPSNPLEGFSLETDTAAGYPTSPSDLGVGVASRVAHHDDYDRVVYEFSGTGVPVYRVGYVDSPTGQGSGDPVEVEGDAYLEVMVVGLGVPPADATDPPQAGSLNETVFKQVDDLWGGFESHGQAFIGIDGQQRPFKVSVLSNPTRLVIDVANR